MATEYSSGGDGQTVWIREKPPPDLYKSISLHTSPDVHDVDTIPPPWRSVTAESPILSRRAAATTAESTDDAPPTLNSTGLFSNCAAGSDRDFASSDAAAAAYAICRGSSLSLNNAVGQQQRFPPSDNRPHAARNVNFPTYHQRTCRHDAGRRHRSQSRSRLSVVNNSPGTNSLPVPGGVATASSCACLCVQALARLDQPSVEMPEVLPGGVTSGCDATDFSWRQRIIAWLEAVDASTPSMTQELV